MILELTTKNILKATASLVCIIILTFLPVYFVFADSLEVIVIAMCFGFVFFILPAFYVFINYYNEDKRKKVSITETQIKVVKSDKVYEINKSEIDRVIILGRRDVLKNTNHRYGLFDDFYYLKIIDNVGNETILTSLLDKNIKEIITNFVSQEQINIEYVFFPSIQR